jgi:hypothetical protein
LYTSESWLNIYDDSLKIIGIFNNAKELIGSFNLYYGSKIGQRYIITPPYSTDIGLWYRDESNTSFQKHKLLKNILNAIAEFLNSQKVMFIDLVMPEHIKDIQPFLWGKFDGTVKYTYLIDLSISENEMLENMSPERRKNIKNAEKSSTFFFCQDSQLISEKVLASLNENKAYFNEEIVRNIVTRFPNGKNHICIGTKFKDQLSSIHFITRDENTANYIFGWNDKQLSSIAGTYGLWNCILFAKKQGVKTFNFAGSALPSIEKYFRGFGGDLTPMLNVKNQNALGKAIHLIKK